MMVDVKLDRDTTYIESQMDLIICCRQAVSLSNT